MTTSTAATTKVRAAIYARFSTDKQDSHSIDDQIARCRRYAEHQGIEVVEEFKDAAQSGSSMNRSDLRRLLDGAARERYQAVLVDDQSRLSRSLEDFLHMRRRLTNYGVEFIDCASGVSSRDKSSKIIGVFQGMANEQYIDDLRDKTHRGLESRAQKGFSAGGRCFGYATRAEDDPEDEEHARRVPIIDEAEAAIVRRIFQRYADGAGLREIADELNRGGVPAPYDRPKLRYSKPAGKGWGHTTIGAILRNERYRGQQRWNVRKWHRDPETGRRYHRKRPAAEHVVTTAPGLVIIDAALWDRVQARRGKAERKGTPQKRRGHNPSPLSTLLVCGVCGHRMSIAGQNRKGHRAFKCAANHSKGGTVCPNGHTISEKKVLTAFAEMVRLNLTAPEHLQRFEETFNRLLAARVKATHAPPDVGALDAAIRRQETTVERVADTLLKMGVSEVLRERLKREEAALRDLRAQRASVAATAREVAPPRLPSPRRLQALWEDVAGTLAADPQAARQALAERFDPVVLTPREEAGVTTYDMATAMRLETRPPASLPRRAGALSDGCGARIRRTV